MAEVGVVVGDVDVKGNSVVYEGGVVVVEVGVVVVDVDVVGIGVVYEVVVPSSWTNCVHGRSN